MKKYFFLMISSALLFFLNETPYTLCSENSKFTIETLNNKEGGSEQLVTLDQKTVDNIINARFFDHNKIVKVSNYRFLIHKFKDIKCVDTGRCTAKGTLEHILSMDRQSDLYHFEITYRDKKAWAKLIYIERGGFSTHTKNNLAISYNEARKYYTFNHNIQNLDINNHSTNLQIKEYIYYWSTETFALSRFFIGQIFGHTIDYIGYYVGLILDGNWIETAHIISKILADDWASEIAASAKKVVINCNSLISSDL